MLGPAVEADAMGPGAKLVAHDVDARGHEQARSVRAVRWRRSIVSSAMAASTPNESVWSK